VKVSNFIELRTLFCFSFSCTVIVLHQSPLVNKLFIDYHQLWTCRQTLYFTEVSSVCVGYRGGKIQIGVIHWSFDVITWWSHTPDVDWQVSFLFVTHQFDWNATSLSSCLLLTVLCLLQCSQQFLCLSHRTLSANALCLGCLSSHSSVRPFVYLLICQFPTDDLIRFWRWKVKDTAGWSIWWQRHPHRCWGIKVHLPVFVYFWPTYTVEGQTSNGRWRLSSSVPLAYAA